MRRNHVKAIVSLALAVAMLLSCAALAEEFTLRNGIAFGDTMEAVREKETFAIKQFKDTLDEDDSDEESDDEDEDKLPYSITTEHGTLAGIDDSYIVYQFDADKTLRNVDYHFRSSSLKETIDSDYSNVNDGLVRKYGASMGNTNGKMYIVSGSAIEGAVLSAYIFKYLNGVGDIRDYDEWDVDAGDYHVKIEQAEYYYGTSYSDITYSHRMSYTYFTDADLEAERDSKNEKQQSVDNDL